MKTENIIKEMVQIKRLMYDMVQPGKDHKPTDDPIFPTQTVLSTWVSDNLAETDPRIRFSCNFLKVFSKRLKEILKQKKLQVEDESPSFEKEENEKEFEDLYWDFVKSIRKFFNWSGIAKEPRINRKQKILIIDKSMKLASAQSSPVLTGTKDSKESQGQQGPKGQGPQVSQVLIPDENWLLNNCSFAQTDLFIFLERNPAIQQFIVKNLEHLRRVNQIYCNDLSELSTDISEHCRTSIKIKQKFDLRDAIKKGLFGEDADLYADKIENLHAQWDIVTRELNLDMIEFLKIIGKWSAEDSALISKNLDDYDFDYIAGRYNLIFDGESYDITDMQKQRFEKSYKERLDCITKFYNEFLYRPSQKVEERPFGVKIDHFGLTPFPSFTPSAPLSTYRASVPNQEVKIKKELFIIQKDVIEMQAKDQDEEVIQKVRKEARVEEIVVSAPVRKQGMKRTRETDKEPNSNESIADKRIQKKAFL